MTNELTADVRIGGRADCTHEQVSDLGLMGPVAMVRCEHCGAVLTVSGSPEHGGS